MKHKRVIVIGGGPSGLIAAGEAAAAGGRVLLLEKMARPGRKLGITGKGRCNITNIAELADFIHHFGKNGQFLHQAFGRFFTSELIAFFENRGLPLSTERGGRVFPTSGRAQDVLKVLQDWAVQNGASIRCKAPVDSLVIVDGRIRGVVAQGEELAGDKVILATGGASYPRTGSTGDGYRLAAQASHSIVPIRPALVPLETEGTLARRMAGLSLKNVGTRLFIDGRRQYQEQGELCFTPFGINGPLVLSFSSLAVDSLRAGKTVVLAIDLKPALSEAQLDLRLQRDFTGRSGEQIASVLRALLPREMVPVCLEQVGIEAKRPAATITNEERQRLLSWVKNIRLAITGHRSFDEAIITAGGVDLREIDPRTMESRLVKGLYIVGELLDLHADTGGYNLQAAFSTGWLAGQDAA